MEEVVGDAALLVRPRDPAGLTEALSRALCDATTRDRLRARGPARAAEFTWTASVDHHLAAYAAAVGSGGDRP
jgi:glycosyltransferase involved in cell wall biosynthesis